VDTAGDTQLQGPEVLLVEVEAVDIQRLLVWYYDAVDPARSHISSRPGRERA
jgi:hypothetical protein